MYAVTYVYCSNRARRKWVIIFIRTKISTIFGIKPKSTQTTAISKRHFSDRNHIIRNSNRNQAIKIIGKVCRYSLYTISNIDYSNWTRGKWVIIFIGTKISTICSIKPKSTQTTAISKRHFSDRNHIIRNSNRSQAIKIICKVCRYSLYTIANVDYSNWTR